MRIAKMRRKMWHSLSRRWMYKKKTRAKQSHFTMEMKKYKCFNHRLCCGQLGRALTVMTDTPAVVLLGLGPVLKCFLILPATDSWCSFPDTPSSWKAQANPQLLQQVTHSNSYTWFTGGADAYVDPRVVQHLHSCESLLRFYLQHHCDQSLREKLD